MFSFDQFQASAARWAFTVFPFRYVRNKRERAHRMLEEALELAQACGCTEAEANDLAAYVFAREVGDPAKEIGDLMVTVSILATAHDLAVGTCAADQLARCWGNRVAIAAKQASKFDNSALPGGLGPRKASA